MDANQLNELFHRQEPLDAELQNFLFPHPTLGLVLQHPLIYEVPYHPQMNALINERFHRKQQAIKDAEQTGAWNRILVLYERAYRWDALEKIASKLNQSQLQQEFAWVWTDSENIYQNKTIIKKLIKMFSPDPENLMDEDERVVFASLPDVVEAYRGCTHRNERGLSWTTDRDRAVWFAKRWAVKKPTLLSAIVKKQDVLFYCNARHEQELVLRSEQVAHVIKKELLP